MFAAKQCILLLLGLVWNQAARAQDEDLPFLLGDVPSADSEWYSGYDGLWDPGWDRSLANSNGPWQLSLVAGAAFNGSNQLQSAALPASPSSDGRNYYAMAMLQVPLQELGAPLAKVPPAKVRTKSAPTRPPRESEPQERSAVVPEDGPSEQSTPLISQNVAADQEPNAQRGQSPEFSALGLVEGTRQERVARTELIVLVKKLLQTTHDAEGHATSMAQLNSLRRRSRTSGLVPELRVRGVFGFDQDTSQQDTGGLYPGDSTTRGGRDSLVEARLTFRLDRLVYGDQEAILFQKRRDLEIDAQKRARTAVQMLVEWMTALRRSRDDSLLFDEWLETQGEEQQALLSLYLATDGWFQGEITLKNLGLHQLLSELRSSVRTTQPEKTPPTQVPLPNSTRPLLP